MLELVKFIAQQFAEKPDEMKFLEQTEDGVTTITIVLAESDMGKVIGRQGKIAKALRTLVKAVGQKENKKYNVEIKEVGEI